MNIHILRNNLRSTIAGKKEVCNLLKTRKDIKRQPIDQMVFDAALNFLETNLDELSKILKDVEVCCAQANEAEWAANPEGMGR